MVKWSLDTLLAVERDRRGGRDQRPRPQPGSSLDAQSQHQALPVYSFTSMRLGLRHTEVDSPASLPGNCFRSNVGFGLKAVKTHAGRITSCQLNAIRICGCSSPGSPSPPDRQDPVIRHPFLHRQAKLLLEALLTGNPSRNEKRRPGWKFRLIGCPCACGKQRCWILEAGKGLLGHCPSLDAWPSVLSDRS